LASAFTSTLLILRAGGVEATYEQYTEANLAATVQDVNYWAQTFTTIPENHNVSTIWLRMYRQLYPSTVTVQLQGVTGAGSPNGTTLWLDGRNASLFVDASPGLWYNFTDTPVELLATTQYSIVVSAAGSGLSAATMWMGGYPGNYTGGSSWYSTNSGVNWTSYSGGVVDQTFKICGEAVPEWVGNTDVEPQHNVAGTFLAGTSFRIDVNNCNISSISVWLNGTGTNCQAEVAVYALNYSFLVGSTEMNITTAGWHTYSIVTTTLLDAGNYYFVVYGYSPGGAGGDLYYAFDAGTGVDGIEDPGGAAFPTWDDPLITPSPTDILVSIYANYTYQLDMAMFSATPSTIGLVNTPWSIRYQPKVFYGASRYWAFYVNMTYAYSGSVYSSTNTTDAYFTSTADNGTTWMAPTDLGDVCEPMGENLAILWNGTHVSVFRRIPVGNVLSYRMGIPQTNGTITWLAAWFDFWATGAGTTCDFFPCLDSNSLPWVSWEYGANINAQHVWVSHSNSINGSWITAPGYPVDINSTLATSTNSFIVALSGGQVYDIYWTGIPHVVSGHGVYGRCFNGTAWEAEQTISTDDLYSQYTPGYETWTRGVEVDSADKLYYVFLNNITDLRYTMRFANGTWIATQTIQSNCVPYCSPSLSMFGSTLYLFYAADKTGISYRTLTAGVWSARALFLAEYVDQIPTVSPLYVAAGSYHGGYDGRINPFTQVAGTNFALLYLSNCTSTDYYKLKFLVIAASSLPTYPTYISWHIVFAPNATDAGATCLFSSYWHDDVGLSGYIFSTNNTGAWINATWSALGGIDSWANATHVLNTTIGIGVSYQWYVNNTITAWNTTVIYTLITTDPALTHPIIPAFSIPYYIPLLGKGIDLLACFGVIALVYANTKGIKDGLKAAVITLMVAIIFIVIWFVMSSLEAYA
jgi:hypothetical protein